MTEDSLDVVNIFKRFTYLYQGMELLYGVLVPVTLVGTWIVNIYFLGLVYLPEPRDVIVVEFSQLSGVVKLQAYGIFVEVD